MTEGKGQVRLRCWRRCAACPAAWPAGRWEVKGGCLTPLPRSGPLVDSARLGAPSRGPCRYCGPARRSPLLRAVRLLAEVQEEPVEAEESIHVEARVPAVAGHIQMVGERHKASSAPPSAPRGASPLAALLRAGRTRATASAVRSCPTLRMNPWSTIFGTIGVPLTHGVQLDWERARLCSH